VVVEPRAHRRSRPLLRPGHKHARAGRPGQSGAPSARRAPQLGRKRTGCSWVPPTFARAGRVQPRANFLDPGIPRPEVIERRRTFMARPTARSSASARRGSHVVPCGDVGLDAHPGRGTIYLNRCRLDVESASPGTGASGCRASPGCAARDTFRAAPATYACPGRLGFRRWGLVLPALGGIALSSGWLLGATQSRSLQACPISPPLREPTLLGLVGWTALSRLESGGSLEHASHRGLGPDSDPVEEAQLAKA
jgi:hypothetical protein